MIVDAQIKVQLTSSLVLNSPSRIQTLGLFHDFMENHRMGIRQNDNSVTNLKLTERPD